MQRRIAPSARIEETIEQVLLAGLDDTDRVSQLGRLGAQLVIQRAVEEEVAAVQEEQGSERGAVSREQLQIAIADETLESVDPFRLVFELMPGRHGLAQPHAAHADDPAHVP